MADRLIITGLGRYDGEYEFDLVDMCIVPGTASHLKVSEYRRIKQFAGVMRGQVAEAIMNDDADLELVLAAIILGRHGKQVTEAALEAAIDADRGSVGWDFQSLRQEESADPPAQPATAPDSSTNGGEPSSRQSENLANLPSRTGTPDSETLSSALG